MFDMQNLTFFTEGNTFTGSKSQGGLLLRYLARPDKESGQLLAWAWNEDLCFERAGEKVHKEFLLTEEGIRQLTLWLEGLWKESGGELFEEETEMSRVNAKKIEIFFSEGGDGFTEEHFRRFPT